MIPLFKVYMPPREALMPELERTLYGGQVGLGPKVLEFEKKFSDFSGREHVVAVSSCTAALHMALILAGVKPGDDVISTPLTAEPTNMAILHAGARVLFCDIEPNGVNVDPESIKRNITAQTTAIVVVFYAGIPADMYHIRQIAKSYGIPVIVDAAHCLGYPWFSNFSRDEEVEGDYTAYSFQAIKHITTGDGGMLAVPEDKLAEAMKLRWFGIDRSVKRTEASVATVGYKYNMNDIDATIGCVAIDYAYMVVECARRNALDYSFGLEDCPGITLPHYPFMGKPSWWIFPFFAENATGLQRKLNESGIECGVVHQRNDAHPVFAHGVRSGLPNLDANYPKLLHIPCGWWVVDEQRQIIIDKIRGGW